MTAPTSPIEDGSDDQERTLLGSRNPFLASNIAAQQTPSTLRDPTTSGTHSYRSTETSLAWKESKHGSFDEQTSRPGRPGSTEGRARTWTTTSPSTGEHHSTSANPHKERSWPESMLTATGSYIAPTPVNAAQTYGHEQRRSINFSVSDSENSPSDSTSASIERTTNDDFQYDWESVLWGYNPKNPDWEDPRPLADSPPNP